MKPILIADQPRLSFSRTVRITVDGIRYRLFRSSVTVAVIAMAVAFLMNILSESLLKRTVARGAPESLARMRLAHAWATRLTRPGEPADLVAELARSLDDAPAWTEAVRMGKLDRAEFQQFRQDIRDAARYLGFFDGLDYARRRSLVHTAAGVQILDRLATTGGWDAFTRAYDTMHSVRRFPVPLETLQDFLARWRTAVRPQIGRVIQGRAEAIARVNAAAQGRPILEALAQVQGPFGAAVRQAGFALDGAAADQVAAQAQQTLDARTLEKSIEHQLLRQKIAQENNVLSGDVTVGMMWSFIAHRSGAARYLEKMADSGLDAAGLTADRLVDLAEERRREDALVRAAWLTADAGTEWFGLGQRMGWLVLVSMLVCVIGISNAMLMSVTERFREIATLKCLGALDGFIMLMFVLESCFLGLVGGTAGALLGSLIGMGRMFGAFGSVFLGSLPGAGLALSMLVAVVLGVILAAVAAVYPAWRAARLAPMEAMRVE